MSRKRKGLGSGYLDPDLPIIPMLDMSFQLLAFFIITFRPSDMEGQIALTLPKDEGGQSISMPSLTDPNQPKHYIVRVISTPEGKIEKMTLTEELSASPPKDLGASVTAFSNELQALSQQLEREKKSGKLTLELHGKLVQANVVQLLDNGIRAGFNDISPVVIPSRR